MKCHGTKLVEKKSIVFYACGSKADNKSESPEKEKMRRGSDFYLKNKMGQAIVEYIVIFIILAATIIIVFGGFSLGNKQGDNSTITMKGLFDKAIDNAIGEINRQ